jgi:hypothetical protein
MKTKPSDTGRVTGPELPPPPPQVRDIVDDLGWLGRLATHGLRGEGDQSTEDESPSDLPTAPELPPPPPQRRDIERRGADPDRFERS